MPRVVKRLLADQRSSPWSADWILFLGALVLALAASKAVGGVLPHIWFRASDAMYVVAASLGLTAVNSALGLHERTNRSTKEALARGLAVAALDTIGFYLVIRVLVPANVSGGQVPFALLPYAFLVASFRPLVYILRQARFGSRRVLILGAGPDALAIHEGLRGLRNVELAGVLPAGEELATWNTGTRVFDRGSNLWQLVHDNGVNEVVVATRDQRGGVLPLRDLLECRVHGIRITDQTAFYERVRGEFPIESLKASWLIYGHGFEQGFARRLAKRCTDVVTSLLLLVLALPIMAITAVAISIDSPGPILYCQERVGRGGRTFRVMKFRSMRTDAERDGVARWAGAGDARITAVGRFIRKTRIDELPQLVNILRGEMSIVGPRPERPTFVNDLKRDVRFYDVRHSVKPGLTGWAQVRFNYAASLEDSRRKLQFDLFYVKNHSLLLDIRILFETVRVVLRGEGAR
jgi:sugar transferase (PEP-CTERM system associated)